MHRSNLNQMVDAILYGRNMHVVWEEKNEPMIVDPHISTNMSGTYLEIYPKLTEALPTMEGGFFHSPLTDKEKKKAIFSCSKSSTIKYLLPSVNKDVTTFSNYYNRADLRRPFQRRQQFTYQSYSGDGFAQAQKIKLLPQLHRRIARLQTITQPQTIKKRKAQVFKERLRLGPVLILIDNAFSLLQEKTTSGTNRLSYQKTREAKTSPQLEEVKSTSRKKKFQMGIFRQYVARSQKIRILEYLEDFLLNGNKFKRDNTQGSNGQDQRLIPRSSKTYKSLNNILTPQGSRAKYLSTQLESVRKSILLLTLGPNNTSNQKSTPGDNNTDNINSVMKDCNMKQKIILHEKQALALDGIEDQRRALKNQELENYAVGFIICNKQRIRCRTKYNSEQQRFLEWERFKNLTESISAAQIQNYLAEIHFTDKLKPSMI
ncbi:hypothetical protein BB561_003528 [Smittium simulii]|uniref:Uncharacterized protein n=1 Tax=Smittium simulii TaxID=133385 RepID=A0A2T9YKW7_9FUNG|nr:hypothetical protein BB561_003528 [Smittium simulii]